MGGHVQPRGGHCPPLLAVNRRKTQRPKRGTHFAKREARGHPAHRSRAAALAHVCTPPTRGDRAVRGRARQPRDAVRRRRRRRARGQDPKHARKELDAYPDCGLVCRGFARLRCACCPESLTVAFSCKGRGFCPSCMGRRMSATAAHLIDDVLPEVALRQWVLTFPFSWRARLAHDGAAVRADVPVRRHGERAVHVTHRRRREDRRAHGRAAHVVGSAAQPTPARRVSRRRFTCGLIRR